MSKLSNFYPVILALLLLLIVWPIFTPGYFSHHDDLQVMRIFEMRKCLEDFQIPCRWVPDMGYGNGFPLFNYYGPFPYYIGSIASFLFGFVNSAKLLFLISLVIGPFAMYSLGKELFGKTAGLVAAVLYAFAPYRALDIYVRGAIGESFALAVIPLVFYFVLRLIKDRSPLNLSLVVISLMVFLTSHTIMTLYFLPILFIWIVFWVYFLKKSDAVKVVLLSMFLGFGLAAFYIVPAYIEKSLVQSDNLIRGDLNFRVHFVTINQLFTNRDWGYGASILGPVDFISFQIGWPHWWVVIASFVISGYVLLKRGQERVKQILMLILIFICAGSVLMTHNQSAVIWERIEILKYSQFPWRFLSVTIFCIAIVGGGLVAAFLGKMKLIIAIVIIASTVFLNWSYFKPEKFYPEINDHNKLSGFEWELQSKAAILDYLPMQAVEPREPAQKKPLVISGQATSSDLNLKSNKWNFSTDVMKPSEIVVPVLDFPNWQVFVNGKLYPHTSDKVVGRIMLNLEPGQYEVKGAFKNTPVRLVSNIISIISLILLVLVVKNAKIKRFVF